MNRIKIYKGEENGIVREVNGYSESLFAEQYSQALMLLDHHLNTINNIDEGSDLSVEYPKIIAFCGERGEGKTSCMLSFRSLIEAAAKNVENNGNTEYGKFCTDKKLKCDNVKGAAKELLWADLIDPAFFDNTHNILELIVGRMYKKYLDICNKPQNNKNQKDIDNLAKIFGGVKRSLTQLDKGKSNAYDPIEDLDDLAIGSDLCYRLSNLIKEYCKFNEKKTLVITIDDIDLNIIGAYQMVEYIRKYLTNKHCVILMSVKISQLINVVSNYYCKNITGLSTTEADTMATNYVNKLIPQGFRVTMPKVYDICHTGLDIYESRQEGVDPKTYHSVKEAVVNLIFNKTRFLFYNSKGSVSPIVPNNLRSLRHLLGLLYDMKDIFKVEEPAQEGNGEQEQEVNDAGANPEVVSFDNIVEEHSNINKGFLESNKRLFKNYFYNTWVKQLSVDNQLLAYKLVNSGDIVSLNKQVIAHLESSIPASREDTKEEFTKLIYKISNPGNYDFNISVGDVFLVMDYLERSSNNQELKLLIFFLKSFYSIKLYECYDKITEEAGEFAPEHNPKVGEIYRSDPWFSRANAMQRLVNGSFFTYMPTAALPPQASNSERDPFNKNRDIKVIDGSMLHELLKEVKSKMDEYDRMGNDAKADFERKFKTCEFFVYTIVTSMTRKEAERQDYWMLSRENSAPIVLSDFNGHAGYYLIDLLAPFYTILNPKFAYMRHDQMKKDDGDNDDEQAQKENRESFYTFAIKHEFTLLNSMIRQVWIKERQDSDPNFADEDEDQAKEALNNDKKKVNGLKRLISNASIRNAEVLSSVWEGIERRRAMRFEGESFQKVTAFYQSMLETSMRTYPYDEAENTPYIMKFGFLKAFIKFLTDNPIEWKNIFESGVKLTSDKDKSKVEVLFANLFEYVKSSRKGNKIKEYLQREMPNVYARRSEDSWNQIFEDNKMYQKVKLAAHLNNFFANDADQMGNEAEQPQEQQGEAQVNADANPEQPIQGDNE